MTADEKKDILVKAKDWFREIGKTHISNSLKLMTLKSFKHNPFLIGYLTYFHSSECDPRSIAKTLIYPRVLGTSINTTFGNAVQKFTLTVLDAFGSTTGGIDIEFTDQRDGTKKYAQLKAGPETINAKDVAPMIEEFDAIIRLARTNHLQINNTNLVVGIVYGDRASLSNNYRNVEKRYDVLIGQEFWHALTGDPNFYYDLIDACAEIAFEMKGKELFEQAIDKLASDPEIIALSKKLQERDAVSVPLISHTRPD